MRSEDAFGRICIVMYVLKCSSKGVTMDYIWDEEKAAANRKKHRVDFNTGMLVFLDQRRVERYDMEHSEEEDRWIATGNVDDAILVVVYCDTDCDDIRRIISARKANKNEQKLYYQGNT